MSQNEIDDLLNYGFKIVQNPQFFKFSLDSVLLADFVYLDPSDKKVLDICTGNAPIPLILSKNNHLQIFGFEIQEKIAKMANESIKINNIKNVKIINDDIKNWHSYFENNIFDIITCNPPYFKYNSESVINETEEKAIARHEIKITLEGIIMISDELLRNKGKLFLVHRTNRLNELILLLNKYHFGIKKIECVYNNKDSDCSMVIIEAKKNSKSDIKIMKPLYSENYRGE